MATETTKTVDFVPAFSLTGDLKKVSEYNFLTLNSKILPVIAILSMEKGSNQLVPNMGAKDKLMEIPFSTREEVELICNDISSQVTMYAGNSVTVKINDEESDFFEGNVVISVDIDGVPMPINLGLDKDSSDKGTFTVLDPKHFK